MIVGNDTKVSKPSYPVQVMLDEKLSSSSSKKIEVEGKPKLPKRRSSNNLLHQEVISVFYHKGNSELYDKVKELK